MHTVNINLSRARIALAWNSKIKTYTDGSKVNISIRFTLVKISELDMHSQKGVLRVSCAHTLVTHLLFLFITSMSRRAPMRDFLRS